MKLNVNYKFLNKNTTEGLTFRLALASHLTGCNILRDVSSVIGFQRDSESLKVPSALGSRGKKRCLNRMISRLFQRIIWREACEKRSRKGYSIVSNSTLFETNVIFSPWTKQVLNLNLLLHCLLWPQIAKNKVLGPLQPLAARELDESFADLMATPGGVQ